MEDGDITIHICYGGYMVECAPWADTEDLPLCGAQFVCVSVDEVLRKVREYIEASEAFSQGAKQARGDADQALKGQ